MPILLIRRRTLFPLLIAMGFALGISLSFKPVCPASNRVARPRVSIVIDDFGGYAGGIEKMMKIPFPLTFAVLPFEEFAREQALQGFAKGYEIIVHFPFQALNANPRWYGEKYISSSSSKEEINLLLDEAFTILPMAVGLNNHMGSQATSDSRIMRQVLRDLSARRVFFLDSRTTMHSKAPTIAAQLNLALISRDIFLDDLHSPYFIRKQLEKLILRARQRGSAVGIGHVGPGGSILAQVLQAELPRYQSEGIEFVFLSELAGTRQINSKKTSLYGRSIGIDPGHGGIDGGTYTHGTMEKDLNLLFALRFADHLKRLGCRVILTRQEDQLLSPYADFRSKRPYKRDDLNRRLNHLKETDIIISIHTNWSPLVFRRGPNVFYKTDSPVAQKTCIIIQEELNKIQPYRKIARPGDYYILTRSCAPAILIEIGYLSNPQERRLLKKADYNDKLINAIIRGLERAFANSAQNPKTE